MFLICFFKCGFLREPPTEQFAAHTCYLCKKRFQLSKNDPNNDRPVTVPYQSCLKNNMRWVIKSTYTLDCGKLIR